MTLLSLGGLNYGAVDQRSIQGMIFPNFVFSQRAAYPFARNQGYYQVMEEDFKLCLMVQRNLHSQRLRTQYAHPQQEKGLLLFQAAYTAHLNQS